jgi:hypothetical protein
MKINQSICAGSSAVLGQRAVPLLCPQRGGHPEQGNVFTMRYLISLHALLENSSFALVIATLLFTSVLGVF